MTSAVDVECLVSMISRMPTDDVFTERKAAIADIVTRPNHLQHAPLKPTLSLPETIYGSSGWVLADTSSHPRKLDRCDSGVVPDLHDAQINSSSGSSSSRYKTELCRPFQENGTCRYGNKCQFAHGLPELRAVIRHPKYKTDLCRTFHTTGLCPYGPRCHFIHNAEERRTSIGETRATARDQDDLERRRLQFVESHQTKSLDDDKSPAFQQRPRLERQKSSFYPESQTFRQTPPHRPVSVSDGFFHHQQQSVLAPQTPLYPVLENDPFSVLGGKPTRSIGSVADSFSPGSSITGSRSPSPSSDVGIGSGLGGPSQTLPASSMPVPPPSGWPGKMDDVRINGDSLASLVSRLKPDEISLLLQILAPPSTPTLAGSPMDNVWNQHRLSWSSNECW